MKRWSRFLERVLALAASPGIAELGPAEQDRLFEQVARATRAERLLAKSWQPHLFYVNVGADSGAAHVASRRLPASCAV